MSDLMIPWVLWEVLGWEYVHYASFTRIDPVCAGGMAIFTGLHQEREICMVMSGTDGTGYRSVRDPSHIQYMLSVPLEEIPLVLARMEAMSPAVQMVSRVAAERHLFRKRMELGI